MFPKPISLFLGFFFFLITVASSVPIYSQDGTTWLDYSTKGNAQTTGHDFALKYPPSYPKASDFSKKDYLQVFAVDDEEGSGDSFYYLTVGIENIPDNVDESTLKTDSIWDLKKLEAFWSTLAKKIPGFKSLEQAINWGSIPMVKYRVYEIKDDVMSLSAVYYAMRKGKLVKLECGFNMFNGDEEFGASTDLTKDPTCISYFNSLKFLD
jgi:hypothetical protein